MPVLSVPVGEKASVGVSKEATFNTFVAPVLFHAAEDITTQPKNLAVQRAGARKRRGQTLPVAGGFEGSGSMTIESEPDVLPQMLAYSIPSQTTPTLVSTSVYSSTLTIGADLPTWSLEVNRVTDAIDYTGCIVDSLAVGMDLSKGLTTKINFLYVTEAIQGAPTTPTFSTLAPFTAEDASNVCTIFGSAAGALGEYAVRGWDFTLSNNIMKGYYSIGNGRVILNWPQQQRKVTGTVKLGFETNAAYKQFLGASAATGPQATVPGVAFDFLCLTTDLIASTFNYQLDFKFPNAFIEAHSAPIKAASAIEQSFTFMAAESANGNQDDVQVFIQNARSTVY